MIPQRISRFCVVAAAAVLLSSCRVDSTVSIVVTPNGSGKISVVVTADKDIVAQTPGLKADIRTDDLKAAGWKIDGPRDTKEGGLILTITHSFNGPTEATALLRQVNGTRGPLHNAVLTRTGKSANSTWSLAGRLEVSGGLQAFADDATNTLLGGAPYAEQVKAARMDLGDAVGITFTASLPGTIKTTTGQVTDGTITWRVPMDGTPTDLATSVLNTDVASSVSRIGKVFLQGLLALWIIASLGLAAMVIFSKRTRRPTPRL